MPEMVSLSFLTCPGRGCSSQSWHCYEPGHHLSAEGFPLDMWLWWSENLLPSLLGSWDTSLAYITQWTKATEPQLLGSKWLRITHCVSKFQVPYVSALLAARPCTCNLIFHSPKQGKIRRHRNIQSRKYETFTKHWGTVHPVNQCY